MDVCDTVDCGSGGDCVEGVCICTSGYSGENCEIYTPVYVRLLTETPLEIVESGIPLDSLYGKVYAGGFIFFIDVDNLLAGAEGMVCTREPLSGAYTWGCQDFDVMGLNIVTEYPNNAFENEVGARPGDGLFNTQAIVNAGCGNDAAAHACAELETAGYDNWFLPAIGTLDLMYKHLDAKGHVDFENRSYWSSTQDGNTRAWRTSFGGGAHSEVGKLSTLLVSAVRTY